MFDLSDNRIAEYTFDPNGGGSSCEDCDCVDPLRLEREYIRMGTEPVAVVEDGVITTFAPITSGCPSLRAMWLARKCGR